MRSSASPNRRPKRCSNAFAPTFTSKAISIAPTSCPSEPSCWLTEDALRSHRTSQAAARPTLSPPSSMRIAVTANGPGEVAGWLRPLLRSLYGRAPDTDVHVFLVPDEYATGFEAQTVKALFPQAHVYD